MRNVIILTACIAVGISAAAVSAPSSPRHGRQPEGICTRDFNRWGQASRCSCGEGAAYDDRAGLCLDGEETGAVLVQGAVSAGVAAVGAETTGFTVETADGLTYELVLTLEDQEKLSQTSGMWFEIEGERITIESVEREHRPALIATEIRVLE